jgi:SAM-dependent methyltransferase
VTPYTIEVETSFLEKLESPVSGGPMKRIHPHILDDGEQQWPLIEGIPYLRLGRDELRKEVLSALSKGYMTEALALLLTDRKDETIPCLEFKDALLAATTADSVRKAMENLGYGCMAAYMYHRWCLPTYLSGLVLLQAHAKPGMSLFEAGCGMGHFLRGWTERSGPAIGCDLVFSNLWLARRFVAPKASMVCCDLDFMFPMQSHAAEICFAQDAFHYFRKKPHAYKEMKRISSRGIVLLGHVHNAAMPNLSPGCPLKLREYAECIHPAVTYCDKDLTTAALTGVPAKPVESAAELSAAQAFGFATNEPVGPMQPWLTAPRPGLPLQLNPLLASGKPQWPNAKFKAEFVDEWSYLREMTYPPEAVIAAAKAGEACEFHARRQAILDLPPRWI